MWKARREREETEEGRKKKKVEGGRKRRDARRNANGNVDDMEEKAKERVERKWRERKKT